MTVKHLSAGIVVFYRDKEAIQFLLLKYPQGHIEFVKGHVEKQDENLQAAAKRELLEETGLSTCNFVPNFYQEIEYSYLEQGQQHEKKVCFYLAEVFDQKINLSHEHLEYFWRDYDQALEQVTFMNAKNLLRSAYSLIQVLDEA